MARKTWNEKMADDGRFPEVKEVTAEKMVERHGGTKMLIAGPNQYDEIMKTVPEGKLITIPSMRETLAEQHGADWTCPLTAGIFVNIVANASDERAGVDETPYWRTVKAKGELCEKFPGGIEGHRARLEGEGHSVISRGKRSFVADFEDSLV